jgi:hemerythrin
MMKITIRPAQISLGVPAMDHAHQSFVESLAQLMDAPDHAFGNGFFALITEMEHDFHEEEGLMEAIDFPGLQSHREEHASILGAFHHAVPKVMQGDYALARLLLELLPQWFLIHLWKMDTPLAVALNAARKTGCFSSDADVNGKSMYAPS